MKFNYFNRLDDRFSALNICVLTPLRALTRSPRSLPARINNLTIVLKMITFRYVFIFSSVSVKFGESESRFCTPTSRLSRGC